MTDQEQLKSLLDYNSETGVFVWRIANGKRVRAGDIAGCVTDRGYIRIAVLGKQYPAGRLAWLYVYGYWPEKQIDHINLNKQDNRICNLREANASENSRNKALRPDSETGFKGVKKQGNKYMARCQVGDKRKYLGLYETAEEAHQAYLEYAAITHGEFFRSH